ncbi:hypothetical protein GF389_04535 [Candidatus Dojkabacteria bacterium]|nr:hypothetical protein [Candidatus Dojkabacteria bacterium]
MAQVNQVQSLMRTETTVRITLILHVPEVPILNATPDFNAPPGCFAGTNQQMPVTSIIVILQLLVPTVQRHVGHVAEVQLLVLREIQEAAAQMAVHPAKNRSVAEGSGLATMMLVAMVVVWIVYGVEPPRDVSNQMKLCQPGHRAPALEAVWMEIHVKLMGIVQMVLVTPLLVNVTAIFPHQISVAAVL